MLIKENTGNYWCLNFLDQFMYGHKGFICGGCFKNIFNKEPIKDLDIFFKNNIDFENACEFFDSQTAGYFEDDPDNPLSEEDADYIFCYENDNVKSYKHKKTGIRIELCKKIFGTAEEILKRFDFTLTKFAYYKAYIEDETGAEVYNDGDNVHIEYRVMMDDKFFEHLHTKRLVLDDRILFPANTLERMFRYAKYGYMPCKETKMKTIKALRDMPGDKIELSKSLYDGMD